MAQQTSYIQVGQRESLSNIIARIDPVDTPLYSNMKKGTSKAILEEHLVQELATASGSNFVNEGSDPAYATPTQKVRLANYHGISRKDVQVSGSLEAVDKAGAQSEFAAQKGLKALELRRDIDKALVTDIARNATDARKPGTLTSVIQNGSAGSGGALATGDYTDVPTGGTDRALSLALIEAAHQAAYIDGGNPRMMTFSPAKKAAFSDLAESASSIVDNQLNMTTAKAGTLVGTTSIFLTDFGTLECVIERQQGDDRVFLIDPDYAEIRTLPGRNFVTKDIAATGDSKKADLLCEWVFIATAPKAHAVILDLS